MSSETDRAGDGSAEITFTDPDLAFLRHVRFGELPGRVRPADMVELVETDPRRDWPDTGPSREQNDAHWGGG
ncbi:hypothetical protein OHA72_20730 [Dactylosporangium sp. NBC_01737]|uniref:hypothetical protein n=1 Tax=Dactylosporangium sp. NBC_01737 TaxID=2975959 RepID=UPI002E16866F|nr:hypothetical protein OHA72_20730 [Dactylosporangium sp. NBC_01737]